MKKKLNIFCVLMLLLMATQVIMTFVMGADDFQEGWRRGAEDANTPFSLRMFFEFIAEMCAAVAALVSFFSFVRFILNVNHDKVFEWKNVVLLRLTGVGLLIVAIIASADEYFTSSSLTEVYDNYFGILIFSVFNLIVAETFAIGLKLKEEQDLTI